VRVHFIGCGDAFGSGGRSNTCFHVTGAQANFLIDCGASSLPALKLRGVALHEIDLILITHFHGDHFAGLPFFILDAQFRRRLRPLTIAGPRGIAARLAQAMEALFENSSKTRQRFDLAVVELEPEQPRAFGAIKVTGFEAVHGNSGGPFLAYRIETEGRVIAYSADTEWTEALLPLGRDADLFIAEAYTYATEIRNHLSYATLVQQLPRIHPKRLILTHMSDDMLAHAHELPHTAAQDGLVVEIQ
jgi:ribonuclease BN (tRNA processing enzyme)